jgi:hypothetical protein
MTDNQQPTETTHHTVEHDVIAIVCEYISLLEVKVMILVFGSLAQFMKCDKPHKTVTKIEGGGKEPEVPKSNGHTKSIFI